MVCGKGSGTAFAGPAFMDRMRIDESGLAAMIVVVVAVVMVAMVFAIPVTFVHLPAALVVVVVGVAPVGAGVGWSLPAAGDPDVAATACSPVTVNPVVAFFRHRRPYLVADRWRRAE